MTQTNPLIPAGRSALLVADFYPVVTELDHGRSRDVLARTNELIALARAKEMPVIFCATTFREGAPEVSTRNMLFAPKKTAAAAPFDPRAQMHPVIDMRDSDIVIAKRRVSAFHATELDLILRANGIDTLVLCGFATRGVVLSTVRQGADLDYALVVVEDCCTERDAAIHDALMTDILPMQARILRTAQIEAAMG